MRKQLFIYFTVLSIFSPTSYLFSVEDESGFVLIDIDFPERINNIISAVKENTEVVKTYIGWVQDRFTGLFAPWQSFEVPYKNDTFQTSLNLLSFDKYIDSKPAGLTQSDIKALIQLKISTATLYKTLEKYESENEKTPGTAYTQIADELRNYKAYLQNIFTTIPAEIELIQNGTLPLDEANKIFKAENDIKTAAKSAEIDPEDFQFTTVPYSGQIFIQNEKLFRGERPKVSLKDYNANKIIYNKDKRKQIEETLVGNYKIHLMPKNDEETVSLINKIIDAIVNDTKLQNSIHSIKFAISSKKLQEIIEQISPGSSEIVPIIVIYPATGKDNAQYVLNQMYQLFKNTQGRNLTPRFNEKITSLLYYAQGDGDDKRKPLLEYFDQNKDYVFYRPDFPEGENDYSLKNPNEIG